MYWYSHIHLWMWALAIEFWVFFFSGFFVRVFLRNSARYANDTDVKNSLESQVLQSDIVRFLNFVRIRCEIAKNPSETGISRKCNTIGKWQRCLKLFRIKKFTKWPLSDFEISSEFVRNCEKRSNIGNFLIYFKIVHDTQMTLMWKIV